MNNLYERLALLNMNKALLMGILLAVIYYLSAFDDGSQANHKLKQVQKQINALTLQKKEIETLLSQEKELKLQIEKKEQYFSILEKHVPVQILSADFHKQIDEFAQSASLEIKNKTPSGIIKGTYIDEVPLQLTAEGDYSQITQFLSFISGSEKTILVNKLNLKANDSKSLKKSITVEVTLNALRQSNERLNETK